MNYLNNIYIINLDKDSERLNSSFSQLNKYNLKGTRFPALTKPSDDINKITNGFCGIICTNGMLSCISSHYQVWKNIVEQNLDYCVILEDDIIITDDFINKYNKYISSIPSDWDMLLLGCVMKCSTTKNFDIFEHLQSLLFFRKFGKNYQVNDDIIRVKSFIGTHAYILTLNGAKKLVQYFTVKNGHLDVDMSLYISNNDDYKCYSFKDELILQTNKLFSSNININKQPYLLNYLLDGISIRKDRQVTLAYILNEQIGSYGAINLNIILLLFFMTGFLAGYYKLKYYYIYLLFLMELMFIYYKRILISSKDCIVYFVYILLYFIGYYIGQKL